MSATTIHPLFVDRKLDAVSGAELPATNGAEPATNSTQTAAFAAGSEIAAADTKLSELTTAADLADSIALDSAADAAADAGLANTSEAADATNLSELTELTDLASLSNLADLANLANLPSAATPHVGGVNALDRCDASPVQICVLRRNRGWNIGERRTVAATAPQITTAAKKVEAAIEADVSERLKGDLRMARGRG